jgi:hypothetical protein
MATDPAAQAAATNAAFQPGSREYGLQVGATAQPTSPMAGSNADLTNPAPPTFGGATIGAQLAGKGAFANSLLPPATPPPVHEGIMKQTEDAAQQNPDAAAAPGGWARTLVAGAQKALSGLGDAAAVGTVPAGSGKLGGAMVGISRTLGARSQREAGERKEQEENRRQQVKEKAEASAAQDEHVYKTALAAHTQVQKLYQEQLTHKLKDEAAQGVVDSDAKFFNSLTTGKFGRQPIFKDITSEEMDKKIKDGTFNPHGTTLPDGTKVPPSIVSGTSRVPTGQKDADGNEIMRTLYSAVPSTGSATLDKETIDRINKFYPKADLKPDKDGKVIMDDTQAAWLNQQALNNEVTQRAADSSRVESELKDFTNEQKLARDKAMDKIQPDWGIALGKAGNDPFLALAHMQKDPAMVKKYGQGIQTPVMDIYGGAKEWETMRHDRETEIAKRLEIAQQGAGGANVTMTDWMKQNIAALPQDSQKLISKYSPNLQASLYAVAFGPGDADFDSTFPPRTTAKSGQMDRETALGIITQLTKGKWSEGNYKNMQQAYKNISTGEDGASIAMYNNVLKHASLAQDVIEGASNLRKAQVLDKGINWLQTHGYGTEATDIAASLLPVKQEFEQLMSKHALTADEKSMYDKLFDPAATPNQLETLFKNIGATGAVRLQGINDRYARSSGGVNVPGLVTKETMDAANHLNLSPNTMGVLKRFNVGDSLFNNSKWAPPTQEKIAQQQAEKDADAIVQKGQQGVKAAVQLPDAAKQQLKPGHTTRFNNGQYWTLDGNGNPIQVQPPPGATK